MAAFPLRTFAVVLCLSPSLLLAQSFDPSLFGAQKWREIGPYRGGRSAAVTGVPGQPDVYYFGACGGGVWKTTDGGRSWHNASDGSFGGSIGAVAVAPSDPNVVYAGGGEETVRGNVSHGDGMWRSTDAGRTWKHVGLEDSRHICRIRVHPHDPDLVYAAVLGHLFGPNTERGVYRSRDGGGTWQRVLSVSDDAGAVDLVMDPTNARILYATTWRVRRTPWSLESGGEGSGLWKSTDGGDHWTELTGNPGLPPGPIGICGVAVSYGDPDSVYAIVEAEHGGVFRSRDAGKTWHKTNDDRSLRQRAWYYSRIYADPASDEAVYVVNVAFHHSIDGGKTFRTIATPHGDNHDLWLAPGDPRRMIEANDGGANVSFDGGKTWSPQDNQPTAQIYRLSTDDDFPYRLLGAQQDNSALRIRSRSALGGSIGTRDWEPTAGGESGYVVAMPGKPELVYGGSYGGYLTWLNHRTGERRAVNVWPDNPMGWGAAELRYRFDWNFPLFFSPHDPNVLYAAGNVLFRSRDGGGSWQPISGDLSRDDKSKQASSGGPITKDNTGVEYHGTIFAALESPHEADVLWAGTDDGLLHVTRDGGESWHDVTPPGMPEWIQINSLEPHPTEPGGLYVAATAYQLDDFRPYLYRTRDYGATWTEITNGIAPGHFSRVIRADPDRPGLLYLGTERGVYVSFDDGGRWQPMQLDLPVVPVTDMAVVHGDLAVATQGRGFWILDDLSVLHQLRDLGAAKARLYEPRPTYRLAQGRNHRANAGSNPPPGVLLHYWLAEKPAADTEIRLEILDDAGQSIRTFSRKPAESLAAADGEHEDAGDDDDGEAAPRHGQDTRLLTADRGLNRFAWDMRYVGAEKFPGMILWNGRLRGPLVVPGHYQARLTVGDWSQVVAFRILPDPRSQATAADRTAQLELLLECRDKLTETHRAIRRMRALRGQLGAAAKRAEAAGAPAVAARAKALREQLEAIEGELYQRRNKSRQDPLNFPIKLDDKLAGLAGTVAAGERAPTKQARQVRDELVRAIDAQLAKWSAILSDAVPAFNAKAAAAGVPALAVPESGAEK